MNSLTDAKQNAMLFLIVLITFQLYSQQREHLTKYFEGIPVINNTDMVFIDTVNQYQYDSMKTMGVNLFWNGIDQSELNFLNSKNIKPIPINTRAGSDIYQWIHFYCDAKWSQWAATGTNDTADAGLERDTDKTYIPPGANYVKTIPFAQAGTIIYGPYYTQENKYVVKISSQDTLPVEYTAEFGLMLQKNDQYPHTDTTVYEMTEPICSLLITTSKINYDTIVGWRIDSVFVINSLLLTRGSFESLNTFKKFLLEYNLGNVSSEYKTTKYRNTREFPEWSGESTSNIEFKVIWLGNPKYQLSVDSVTVYDYRGYDIINFPHSTIAQINSEINVISVDPAYPTTVIGWHGIDEVMSIDNFEPIRIVANILQTNGLRLYLLKNHFE